MTDQSELFDLLELQQDEDMSCSERLAKIRQNASSIPRTGLYYVSEIIGDCVESNQRDCLETVYVLAKENVGPDSDLRHGLMAISNADMAVVNDFIQSIIEEEEVTESHYLSRIVPYLYRGHESELVEQLEEWKETHEYFFWQAIDLILKQYNRDSEKPNEEFADEIQLLKSTLQRIAKSNGVEPNDSGLGNSEIAKVHNLTKDIYYEGRGISKERIQKNLELYPNLKKFLTAQETWLDTLLEQNQHPLAYRLSYEHTEEECRQIVNSDDAEQSDKRNAKFCLDKIALLRYYDECFAALDMESDSDLTSNLRHGILDRSNFESAIAEIEVLRALRSEFGPDNVEFEPEVPESSKVTDYRVSIAGENIWIELKHPDPSEPAAIGDIYSLDMDPESSPVRSAVTEKMEQLNPAKEATDDLTMVLLKTQPSKIDEVAVRSYVAGPEMAVIPEDGDTDDLDVVRGKSGLSYNERTENLDILAHYKTTGDATEEPYIRCRGYLLSDIDEDVVQRLSGFLT
ncbi:hypothetical protein [Halobaculum roseum]|uniref:Uncharacterized protein n=1 Tax=Halobaculum roseum TaxID=2175149 RepID=A0ABD5MWF4_9EURY|nr:hypothetical protein [Halobaculum roseum]QZY01949.1 hypothetical protein K6T36_11595 [Halobaculum roseum]